MPGLGASFGRGAATTFTRDLSNSDCVLIMGSNMAEAHPVGFRWPLKARERGATLIHVDPRFSRTSAMADVYVPIRAGTDIAFLGGIINYIIANERWFKEYVLHYTNASFIVGDRFRDTEDLNGLFSGFDQRTGYYDEDRGAWGYKTSSEGIPRSIEVETDETLTDPRCVFQVVKRHFSRYTPEQAAEICGCRPADVIKVAELLCRNSGRERTSAIVYAVGWTQHSTGVQMIRAAGIIQLLLGNIGRPGGGIMAMRGHCSIQGSTDIPTLYDMLPGYLPQPVCDKNHETLDGYVDYEGLETGYWANFRKFVVSLLRAWYGPAAMSRNEFHFDWLPRIDGDYSQLPFFKQMAEGHVDGYFVFGQNPAGGGPNAGLHRAGLRKLKWLVVLDWFQTETAVFWRDDPKGPPPSEIQTEVFFIPAASIACKEGS